MKLRHLAIATLTFAPLFGCNSTSSTGPGTTNTTAVTPKVGSTYTTLTTDPSSPNLTQTYTVVATGMTTYGKSGVTAFVSDDSPSDTNYVVYESNGDVSTYLTNGQTAWVTYPFGSQKSSTQSYTDPSTGDQGTVTLAGEGSGTSTVSGKSYATKKASLHESFTSSGVPLTIDAHLVYAPSVGYLTQSSTTFLGQTSVETLTSFSLK